MATVRVTAPMGESYNNYSVSVTVKETFKIKVTARMRGMVKELIGIPL